jgi:hypothetical protein
MPAAEMCRVEKNVKIFARSAMVSPIRINQVWTAP